MSNSYFDFESKLDLPQEHSEIVNLAYKYLEDEDESLSYQSLPCHARMVVDQYRSLTSEWIDFDIEPTLDGIKMSSTQYSPSDIMNIFIQCILTVFDMNDTVCYEVAYYGDNESNIGGACFTVNKELISCLSTHQYKVDIQDYTRNEQAFFLKEVNGRHKLIQCEKSNPVCEGKVLLSAHEVAVLKQCFEVSKV